MSPSGIDEFRFKATLISDQHEIIAVNPLIYSHLCIEVSLPQV
ncbi:MAG: hypothetical protein AAGB35_04045 [Pseudomonadota bacterium]